MEQRLDALLPGLLADYAVPGAAIAVMDGDAHLLRTYGLRRNGTQEPVGSETVFEAASLGKPLFAYAIVQRVVAGDLDLDRPLSGVLEEPFLLGDDRIHEITARRVLSHTTGFPNWRPNRFSSKPGALEILRQPGSAFGYSGEGYMYLQAVIEQETGKRLDAVMQSDVFAPLGMTRSAFVWSEDFAPDFALPHNDQGEPGVKQRLRLAGAAYSLHSTLEDFARFLSRMLAEDDATADAMLRPQIAFCDNAALGWSLGWGIERREDGDWFWQWGDNQGFKHFVMGSRSRQKAVLVFTNGDRGANVHRAVTEAVLGFSPQALELDLIRY